jgi:hypothetical protein
MQRPLGPTRRLGEKQLLVVHGMKDALVPIGHSMALARVGLGACPAQRSRHSDMFRS